MISILVKSGESMKHHHKITFLPALMVVGLVLVGCSSEGDYRYSSPTPAPTVGGNGTVSTFPKAGHAPDYSWIAGRVTFTRIQGGCVYIYTDPAEIEGYELSLTPAPEGVVSGVTVGTSAHSDTSPPLRDITPQTGAQATQPPGSRFVASGNGWDESKVKDGDYVVLFGRLARQGEPTEICPGGTAYVVDRWVVNP
jgi:hypothetical protein